MFRVSARLLAALMLAIALTEGSALEPSGTESAVSKVVSVRTAGLAVSGDPVDASALQLALDSGELLQAAPDWTWLPAPSSGISPRLVSLPITAGSCVYEQANDDPHISSTLPRATSVHGWWNRLAGSCPATATVTTELAAYGCFNSGTICTWLTVAGNSKAVVQGGGSGNWVTGRFECVSTSAIVGWRGHVDVDFTGVLDPPGWTDSKIKNWACSP